MIPILTGFESFDKAWKSEYIFPASFKIYILCFFSSP